MKLIAQHTYALILPELEFKPNFLTEHKHLNYIKNPILMNQKIISTLPHLSPELHPPQPFPSSDLTSLYILGF